MTFKESQRAAGREYLQRVISQHRGKTTAAALEAGVSRQTLYKFAAKYGVPLQSRPYRKRAL